jgi:ribonuclease HI
MPFTKKDPDYKLNALIWAMEQVDNAKHTQDYMMFTDGSAMDGKESELNPNGTDMNIGAGVTMYRTNGSKMWETSLPGNEIGTCFEAEAMALLRALVKIKQMTKKGEITGKVTIFSDSQAVLDEVAATGKRTTNTWIQDARDTLYRLHLDPRITVTLRWIPGHVGLYYNEEVDELAKQGAKNSTVNLDNMRGTKIELKVHETAMRKLNKKGKNKQWQKDKKTKVKQKTRHLA